ncbi:hypothetical protein EI94DRAFT_1714898 [Lactarius quietus]|nr:hypothetical protein EI94DRAFT_1714898 [Lactarius quietus]
MVCFSLRLSRRSCKVRVARVDPIPFHIKNDATGLGKTSQDFRMIETTVSQRRELDSERQRNETEEQRRVREVRITDTSFILLVTHYYYSATQGSVARRAALQTEISEVLRPFYCTVCDKQFQNVAQYDEHTNSYAHHHKIRFRDMQNTQRAKQNTLEEQERRKEKERKREEKELRKIAAAAGVKMTKSMPNAPALAPVPTSGDPKPLAFKKGGWASIPSTSVDAAATSATGLGAVGSSADSSHSPSPAPDAVPSSSGFSTTPATPHSDYPPDQRQLHQPAPAFRTAGWSSMDGTTQPPPPPPPPLPFHDVPAMAVATERHLPDQGPSATPPTSSIPVSAAPGLAAVIAAPEALAPKPSKSKKAKESELRENARSGWQNFQKGGRRK